MTATPDAVQTTLEEFIAMIPPDQREVLASDITRLLSEGWGELVFTIVRGKISGHVVTVSKVYNRQ